MGQLVTILNPLGKLFLKIFRDDANSILLVDVSEVLSSTVALISTTDVVQSPHSPSHVFS